MYKSNANEILQDTKEAAVQEMRDAKVRCLATADTSSATADTPKAQSDSNPPAKSNILGSLESAAGSATGCEGMVEEGKERKM